MRKMKDSGIEWVGDIPTNWDVKVAFQLFGQVKNKNSGLIENNLLSLSYGKIKRKNIDTVGGLLPENFDGYNIIEADDIVLRLTDLQNDHTSLRVGLATERGIVTSAYLTLRNQSGNLPLYLYYYLHTFDVCKGFYGMGSGVRQGLNWDGLKLLKIVLPPVEEQIKITNYLESKCFEIDAVIEKTKATIEEYKKLKQSVITEAVTKGIRGNRPMKDSGIEWIGEIPAEWNISRIKYVSHFEPSSDRSELNDESVVTYTPMECIKNGWFINQATPLGSISSSLTAYQNGDIVMAKVTPCFENGNIAIMENLFSGYGLGSSELFVFRAKSIERKYLFYWLRNNKFIQNACSTMTGTGGLKRVSPAFVKNCYLHLPPIEEQLEITNYLEKKCAEIDTLIAKKTKLLTELETYKKSLIYEYVTGNKEVGEVSDNTTVAIVYPCFPAVLSTKKARFAQAVLMSKILDSNVKHMGRVKLEKMLFTIEHSLGFNFDTEYVREMAGPLDGSIYECEKIVSRTNKWFYVNNSQNITSYKPQKNMRKYKKYYEQYFSDYNEEIENIISIFENYSLEQSEIVATLFAAWNDAIIDKKQFTDEDIVNDVLNNWHESKTRFSKDVWLRAMDEMRKNNLVPKGYGKKTVIKN